MKGVETAPDERRRGISASVVFRSAKIYTFVGLLVFILKTQSESDSPTMSWTGASFLIDGSLQMYLPASEILTLQILMETFPRGSSSINSPVRKKYNGFCVSDSRCPS